MSRGEVAYKAGDYEVALEQFRLAQDEALEAADSATVSVALTWRGLAHWQLGEYREARAYGEEALDLKTRLGLWSKTPKSLNALGLLAWSEGRLADAMALHERSLDAARQAADTSAIARALNNLALVQTDLGQLTAAGERYQEAREIFRRIGESDREARVLTNVGALQAERGDAVAAEEALAAAFALYGEAEDPRGEVNAMGQLGVVYAAQGDPERGLHYLDSALVIARELGLRTEEASNLEQLANIHGSLGSHRLALDLFERADRINTELGRPYEHGANLRARSAIHRDQGNHELAVDLVERALELHESIGASGEVLTDLLQLARLRQDQSHEEQAAALDSAEALATTLESTRARVEVALTRAELAGSRADPRAMLSALDEVASDVPGVSVERQWRWELSRARALSALGSPDAAAAARRAVDLVERVRASLSSSLLRSSLAEGRTGTYHALVEILLAEGRIEEAFEVSDAARGTSLARHFALSGARDPTTDNTETMRLANMEELLVTIGHLDRSLDAWYGSVPPEGRDAAFDAEVKALQTERERARLEYSRLLAQTDRSASRAESLLGSGHSTPEAVQAALDADEALAEFLLTRDRLVTFVVRSDGLFVEQADLAESALKSRLRVARSLAADPNVDRSAALAVLSGLFDLLVRPALGSGALDGAETLILVPDGHLTYVPFAALYDRERERHLVESHVLVDQPSATAWLATRRSPLRAGGPAPRAGAGFAPFPNELPASADEVLRFAASHPGDTFVGVDATERRLRDALASDVIVHAAAHGVMNARNPLFSRLELRAGSADVRDDGALSVHEILGQRSRAPLVFLSACETGAGPAWAPGVTGGEDYAALSRSLLYTGARTVVATLWPVQDRAAARFAELFYRELGGAPVAAALARTQRTMLSEEATSAPFFWAGYRVTGDGALRISPQNEATPPV